MRARCLLAMLTASCSLPPDTVKVRVELPEELADAGGRLRVLPQIAEAKRHETRGVVVLELKRAPLRIELPFACSERLDTRAFGSDSRVRMKPLYDAGPKERYVGLGEPFTVQARVNCAEAKAARARLTASGGAQLEAIAITEDGLSLSARTHALAPPIPRAPGIVPVSAAKQQRWRSELTLRVTLADGTHHDQILGVASLARSTGLPNVGLSQPVLIAGAGWKLVQKPAESHAKLRSVAGLFELQPDETGRYRLQDDGGRTLSIHSGRYDEMPLDCGRADCHAAIAKSALSSPMARTLESDLGGCHTLDNPSCASACHATGEPGIADGGFTHVARALGIAALPEEYEDLPAPLRRLGGVGCMACHGPAAIPEPSARWAILRGDVCAVCHDAPPRYGHFQALATSRMATADRDERTRNDPSCARCHTTWGAVERAAPPSEVGPLGLGCITCHAVHPKQPPPANEHGLLREMPAPAGLPEVPASLRGPSRVCVGCHAPSAAPAAPEASAAALVAGQGGLDPQTGNALSLPPPHAAHARGCLSCHDSGPEALVLGKSHGFRAGAEACSSCHERQPARDPSIRTRAQALLARLSPERDPNGGPAWHAQRVGLVGPPERQRALFDVLLVLEDPAADVHHPGYAKLLLDAAERSVTSAGETP